MDSLVMRKIEGEWVPELHCGSCLQLVGSAGLILWDARSERVVVTPAVACSEACGATLRGLVPDLTLEQMPLDRFFLMVLAGTGTTNAVDELIDTAAFGRFIRDATTGGR